LVAEPAASQVTLSPILGYQIPNEDTQVHVGGELSFSEAGTSAIGLDAVVGRLPFEFRAIGTYLNIGNVVDSSNRELDVSGHHWGLGVQRRFSVGQGAIELQAAYLYLSENFHLSLPGGSQTDLKRGDSGFMGGVRFVAPFSETIELAVLAKLEFAGSYTGQVLNEFGDVVELTRPGTTSVFAVGINWHISSGE